MLATKRRPNGFGVFFNFYQYVKWLSKNHIEKVTFGRLYDDPYTYRVDIETSFPYPGPYEKVIRRVPRGLREKIVKEMYRENDGHVVAEKTWEYFNELDTAIADFLSHEGFEFEGYAREDFAEVWVKHKEGEASDSGA